MWLDRWLGVSTRLRRTRIGMSMGCTSMPTARLVKNQGIESTVIDLSSPEVGATFAQSPARGSRGDGEVYSHWGLDLSLVTRTLTTSATQ